MTDLSLDVASVALLSVVAIWLVLQIWALIFFKGMWRIAASFSAAAMILAVAVGILGGLAGADMAPIWIFIALPLCILWIVLLWLAWGIALLLRR